MPVDRFKIWGFDKDNVKPSLEDISKILDYINHPFKTETLEVDLSNYIDDCLNSSNEVNQLPIINSIKKMVVNNAEGRYEILNWIIKMSTKEFFENYTIHFDQNPTRITVETSICTIDNLDYMYLVDTIDFNLLRKKLIRVNNKYFGHKVLKEKRKIELSNEEIEKCKNNIIDI